MREQHEYVLKDSGQRESFDTGAVRDITGDKLRYSLLPSGPLKRIVRILTEGAKKYSDWNWAKGMPFSRVYDSKQRHSQQWWDGEYDEDHLAQEAVNCIFLMYYEEAIKEGLLPETLDDRPL